MLIDSITEFIPLFIIMFRIAELRHKRVYGCRKKRLNIATFFDNLYISQSTRIVKTMKPGIDLLDQLFWFFFYHNKNDCDGCNQGRETLKWQKNGGSWGYEPPDEEDIEICIRCIDLWGNVVYKLLQCGMSSFFLFFYNLIFHNSDCHVVWVMYGFSEWKYIFIIWIKQPAA